MSSNNFEQLLLTTISNDICIIKNEKFNIDRALWLVSQPNDTISYNDKKKLQKMIKQRFKGNYFEAVYKLGKQADGTIGRLTVKGGVGLQNLSRDIRACLMENLYWDIDFVNAQPNILLQVCKIRGWNCDNLEYYCNNRELLFQEFQKENELYTRQYIKEEFIRILFGGKPDMNTPQWIRDDFYKEIDTIMENVCNSFPKIRDKVSKKNPNNIKGSTCALFLQTIERQCLMALDNVFAQHGRNMSVLIHDGGGVERIRDEIQFPDLLLKKAQEFVFETTGFNLQLAIKPIKTTFEIPERRTLKLENTYDFVKCDFEQKHFKCIKTGLFYEINEDELVVRKRNELITSYEHLVYEIETKDGDVDDKPFVIKWLADKNMRVYEQVGLYPPPLTCPKNHFNLWSGFRIDKINIDNLTPEKQAYLDEGLQFILEHFKKLSGEECFDFFIKWNAMLIQKPAIKPLVAILLKSKPGLGKERYFLIMEKIFGSKYCLLTQNAEQIVGSFNSLIEGKILIGMDELTMAISATKEEELKCFITSDENLINPKHCKPYLVKSYNHLVSFSNKDFPFKIDDNDRRYLAIDVWDEPIPEHEYFNKLMDYINDDLIIRKVFEYFNNIDITTFKPKEERPQTAFMTELKTVSRPLETQFIIDLIQNMVEKDIRYTSQELFFEFKNYITNNFTDIKYSSSSNKLSLRINRLQIDGIMKTHSSKCQMWNINKEQALEWCYKNNYIERPLPRLLR